MLAYVAGKICAVDGYGLLSVCVVYVMLQFAIHHTDRETDRNPHPSTAQILPATYASI
jgi:Ca2+/Na+ antiporter